MNDRTLNELDEAVRLNPEDAEVYISRGITYCERGDYNRALADFNKAIQLDSKSATEYPYKKVNGSAHLYRGLVYFRKGDYNLALADFYKAIQLDPILINVIEFPESPIDEFYEVVDKVSPESAEDYYNRGMYYKEIIVNNDLAYADFSEAIRLNPQYAEAYHDRGQICEDENKRVADYSKAIQFYNILSDDSRRRFVEICRDRANLYEDRQTIAGYSKAIADYERAGGHGSLHYYEQAIDVYFKRGKLYAEDGNYDSAIADMSHIIQLDDSISHDYDEGFRRGPNYDPDSYPSNYGSVPAGQAYNNRGIYCWKKGKYNQAISDLTEVLEIYNERIELEPESNPDFAIIYLNLGSIYLAKKDYDEAVENYDNVVRLCPNYQTDFIESKFAHGGKKTVNEAIELLNNRVNTPMKNAVDYYYVGVQSLFRNDGLSAKRAFEIALKEGYGDQQKIKKHLENLNRTEK